MVDFSVAMEHLKEQRQLEGRVSVRRRLFSHPDGYGI